MRHYRRGSGADANHRTARTALHQRQRRSSRQFPPQKNRCRNRAFRLDRSQAYALTESLSTLRTDLLAIVRAALRAADAGSLVERALTQPRHGDNRFTCIAVGKAAPGMAAAASRVLGDRISEGLIVSPALPAVASPFEHIAGGHPVPTEGSERAGRRALALAKAARNTGNQLLVLISGGASALMALPAAGLSLIDKRNATDVLLRSGADIHALNTVRKHLSAIKGGQLAAASSGCQALAISDVVGDDPSVIGSGPTVPDPSTFSDALALVNRFGGVDAFPAAVISVLSEGARGARSDTPKPGDPRLDRAETRVIGGRDNAMQGAAGEARRRGYHVLVVQPPIVGDAREAARE